PTGKTRRRGIELGRELGLGSRRGEYDCRGGWPGLSLGAVCATREAPDSTPTVVLPESRIADGAGRGVAGKPGGSVGASAVGHGRGRLSGQGAARGHGRVLGSDLPE